MTYIPTKNLEVYSSDWEVLLNQKLKDVDTHAIRNPEIRNYIEAWKFIKPNQICQVEEILKLFNYFYDYTFYATKELDKTRNYVVLEIFYETNTYRDIKDKTTTLISKLIDTKYIVYTHPDLKKLDNGTLKAVQNTVRPSRWYKLINNPSLKIYNYVIKFDETNFEVSNESIIEQDLETVLGGGFIDVDCDVNYSRDDLYRIHLEMKELTSMKPAIQFMKYTIPSIFNPYDQNDTVEKTIKTYETYKEMFPTLISKSADVALFRAYLSLLKPSEYNKATFEKYVLDFFSFKSPKARKKNLN
jgi:hypothetical protein